MGALPPSSSFSAEDLLGREWYLDTSLFHDFLDRKVPLAYRGARPHDGKTIAQLAPGSHSQVFAPVLIGGMRLQVELTQNIHWLRMIAWVTGVKFIYSELVRAEAIRRLRRSHPGATAADLRDWWELFAWLLKNYGEVSLTLSEPQALTELALTFPLPKNVQDYMHLLLARDNNAFFVTSDRLGGQIQALRDKFYPNIVYWPQDKRVMLSHPKLRELLGEAGEEAPANPADGACD